MPSFTIFSFVLALMLVQTIVAKTHAPFENPVYMIGIAETPVVGSDLTPIGQQRAQSCIPSVFNASTSPFNIGLIIACQPDPSSGVCVAAIETISPFATAFNIPIDSSCGTGASVDDNCVPDIMDNFVATSNASILITWDPVSIDGLMDDFPVDGAPNWPVGHYDAVWQLDFQAGAFIWQESQNCTGIDGDVALS